jgi:hypothetical protein
MAGYFPDRPRTYLAKSAKFEGPGRDEIIDLQADTLSHNCRFRWGRDEFSESTNS